MLISVSACFIITQIPNLDIDNPKLEEFRILVQSNLTKFTETFYHFSLSTLPLSLLQWLYHYNSYINFSMVPVPRLSTTLEYFCEYLGSLYWEHAIKKNKPPILGYFGRKGCIKNICNIHDNIRMRYYFMNRNNINSYLLMCYDQIMCLKVYNDILDPLYCKIIINKQMCTLNTGCIDTIPYDAAQFTFLYEDSILFTNDAKLVLNDNIRYLFSNRKYVKSLHYNTIQEIYKFNKYFSVGEQVKDNTTLSLAFLGIHLFSYCIAGYYLNC